MKEQIILNSRYGDKNYLNRIGGEDSKRYCLQTQFYYRMGLAEDSPDEYSFVDPSGGPFISKGCNIDGNIVKSITTENSKIIIEFE